MFALLVVLNLNFIIFLFFFSMYVDLLLLIDICVFNLILEMLVALLSFVYAYYSNLIFFVDCLDIFNGLKFFQIKLIFYFDEVSSIFLFITSFTCVICFYFLVEYFQYDFNNYNIIVLSSLFTTLIFWYFCVFDIFLIFFFWESISFVSFFLIQYWGFRLPSYKSSLKVFLISQLGDLPFLIFLLFLVNRFSTTNLFEILLQINCLYFEYFIFFDGLVVINCASFLSFLLIFSTLLKAAQFFFYPWLLDAMEAPVPISAQLHSSTLVIIGFYTLFRFYNIIIFSKGILLFLVIFGVLSIVSSSVLGFFQVDGKKLLACSTASQLGYVITGIGLLYFEESLIMLFFSCCNKAFTFIWFGILIDKYNGVSDFRVIAGTPKISLSLHIGIFISLVNFIAFPGLFSWQVKSLFDKGHFLSDCFFIKYIFDILLLSWFFTSLYLIYFYIVLFLKPIHQLCKAIPQFDFFFKSEFLNFNFFFIKTPTLLICFFFLKFNFIFNFSFLKNFLKTKTLNFLNLYWTSYFFFLSWSFFLILFFILLLLLIQDLYIFNFYFDLSWIGDFFVLFNNYFFDFYLF